MFIAHLQVVVKTDTGPMKVVETGVRVELIKECFTNSKLRKIN